MERRGWICQATVVLALLLLSTAATAQSSDALIEQIGPDNVAHLSQTGSIASVQQTGALNAVWLDQSGGAFAEIIQIGDGHQLFGPGGSGTAAVSADASQLHLLQTGSGNTAIVDQSAGSTARITQSGSGNTAIVTQGTSLFYY